jgi:hypothetical protein
MLFLLLLLSGAELGNCQGNMASMIYFVGLAHNLRFLDFSGQNAV